MTRGWSTTDDGRPLCGALARPCLLSWGPSWPALYSYLAVPAPHLSLGAHRLQRSRAIGGCTLVPPPALSSRSNDLVLPLARSFLPSRVLPRLRTFPLSRRAHAEAPPWSGSLASGRPRPRPCPCSPRLDWTRCACSSSSPTAAPTRLLLSTKPQASVLSRRSALHVGHRSLNARPPPRAGPQPSARPPQHRTATKSLHTIDRGHLSTRQREREREECQRPELNSQLVCSQRARLVWGSGDWEVRPVAEN